MGVLKDRVKQISQENDTFITGTAILDTEVFMNGYYYYTVKSKQTGATIPLVRMDSPNFKLEHPVNSVEVTLKKINDSYSIVTQTSVDTSNIYGSSTEYYGRGGNGALSSAYWDNVNFEVAKNKATVEQTLKEVNDTLANSISEIVHPDTGLIKQARTDLETLLNTKDAELKATIEAPVSVLSSRITEEVADAKSRIEASDSTLATLMDTKNTLLKNTIEAANGVLATRINVERDELIARYGNETVNLISNSNGGNTGSTLGWSTNTPTSLLATTAPEVPAGAPSRYVFKMPNYKTATNRNRAITGGSILKVSYWVTTTTTTAQGNVDFGLTVAMVKKDGSMAYAGIGGNVSPSSALNTWKKIEGTYTLPADVIEVQPYMEYKATISGGYAANPWYFTNVEVKNVSESEPIKLRADQMYADVYVTNGGMKQILNTAVTDITSLTNNKASVTSVTDLTNVVNGQGGRITTTEGILTTNGINGSSNIAGRVTTIESDLNTGPTSVKARITTVESTKADSTALTAAANRVTALESEVGNSNSRITTVETTLNDSTSGVVTRLNNLSTTVSNNNTTLTGSINSLSTSKADLTALTAANTKIQTLENELNTSANGGANIKARLGTVENTVTTTNSAYATRLNNLESNYTAVTGKINAVDGVNKWRHIEYPKGTFAQQYPPTLVDWGKVVGTPSVSKIVDHSDGLFLSTATADVIVRGTTAVYVAVAKTINFTISADDGVRVFVNGESIFFRANYAAGQTATITANLRAGWNTIDISFGNGAGAGNAGNITPALSTLVDYISLSEAIDYAPISTANAAITDEATTRANADSAAASRLTNLETSVNTQNTGLLARMTNAENTKVDNTTFTAATNRISTLESESVKDLKIFDGTFTKDLDTWATGLNGLSIPSNSTALQLASITEGKVLQASTDFYSKGYIPVNPYRKYKVTARYRFTNLGAGGDVPLMYLLVASLDKDLINIAPVPSGGTYTYGSVKSRSQAVVNTWYEDSFIVSDVDASATLNKFRPGVAYAKFGMLVREGAVVQVQYILVEDATSVEQSNARITSVETTLTNADSAMAGRLNTIETSINSGGNSLTNLRTSITNEATARTTADSTLGSLIDTLTTTVSDNNTSLTGSINNLSSSKADLSALNASNARITVIETDLNTQNSGIKARLTTAENTIVSNNSATASRLNTLETNVNTGTNSLTNLRTGIDSEVTARSTADTTLGNRIDTLTSTVDSNKTAIEARALNIETTKANLSALNAEAARINSLEVSVANKDNLVRNQAFETDLSFWGATLPAQTSRLAYNAGEVPAGAPTPFVMKISGRDTANNPNWINATAGDTFYVSMWCANTATTTNTLNFMLHGLTLANTSTYLTAASRPPSDAVGVWKKVEGIYTVPAGVHKFQIFLQQDRSPANTDTNNAWYVANIELRQTNTLKSSSAKITNLESVVINGAGNLVSKVSALESNASSFTGATNARLDNLDTIVSNPSSGLVTKLNNLTTETRTSLINLTSNSKFQNGLQGWAEATDGSNPGVITGGSIVGGKFRINRAVWMHGSLVPVNTARTYRVRFKTRVVTNGTLLSEQQVYAGVATYDANGALQTSAPGTHRYCAAAAANVVAADGWRTFEGIITGEGNTNANQFRPGTVFVRPIFILNYSGGNAIAEAEYLEFEDITDLVTTNATITNLAQTVSNADTALSNRLGVLETSGANSVVNLRGSITTLESSKADLSALTSEVNRVTNLLANTKLETKQGHWLFTAYAYTPGIPYPADFKNMNLTYNGGFVPDGTTIVRNIGDTYIGRIQTNVYVDSAKTVNLTFSHDDGARLIINGVEVYGYGFVRANNAVSFNLNAGWNSVEFIWQEGGGQDGIYDVTPTLSSQVKYLAYNGSDNLSIAKDEVTARTSLTDSLASRTSALESSISNGTTGLSALKSSITNLENTRATNGDVSAVSGRLTTVENNVNSGANSLANLRGSISSLESTRATNTEVSNVSGRVSAVEASVNNGTNSLTNLRNSITTLDTNKADLTALTSEANRITALNARVGIDASNLVGNPSADRGAEGWVNVYTRPDSVAPTPNTFATSSRDSFFIPNNYRIPVTPGERYYFSMWTGTPANHGVAISIGYRGHDKDGTVITFMPAVRRESNDAPGSWKQSSGYLTIPAGTAYIVPWVQLDYTGSNATWFFTKVEVRSVSQNKEVDSKISTLETTVSTSTGALAARATNLEAALTTGSGITNFAKLNEINSVSVDAQGKANATYGVNLDVNGRASGWKNVNNGTSSIFSITADKFYIYNPTVGDSPVFGMGVVNGVNKLALRGDMIVDGAITANKLTIGNGVNLVPNSSFIANLTHPPVNSHPDSFWRFFNYNGSTAGLRSDWAPIGKRSIFIADEVPTAQTGDFGTLFSKPIPIDPSKYYAYSVLLNKHRADGSTAFILWTDASDSNAIPFYGNVVERSNTVIRRLVYRAAPVGDIGFHEHFVALKPPASARYARLVIQKGHRNANEPNSYLFATEVMFEASNNPITEPSPWSEGGLTVIDGSMIQTGYLSADRIAANTIVGEHIVSETITAGKLATNSVVAGNIAAGAITADKILSGSITTTHLNAQTFEVDNIHIKNGAIAQSRNIAAVTRVFSGGNTIYLPEQSTNMTFDPFYTKGTNTATCIIGFTVKLDGVVNSEMSADSVGMFNGTQVIEAYLSNNGGPETLVGTVSYENPAVVTSVVTGGGGKNSAAWSTTRIRQYEGARSYTFSFTVPAGGNQNVRLRLAGVQCSRATESTQLLYNAIRVESIWGFKMKE